MEASLPKRIKVCRNDYMHQSFKKFVMSRPPDVHFICEGGAAFDTQKISVHKEILAASSNVFDRMFFGDLKEEADVKIVDASPAAFKEFLQFFYEADVKLTIENIDEVLMLAQKYEVINSMDICEHFLGIYIADDNLLWVLNLTEKFELNATIELCQSKIGEDLDTFVDSSEFLECNQAALKAILQTNGNACELFKAALKWASAACTRADIDASDPCNVRDKLGDNLLSLIRFSEMSANELANIVSSNRGLIPSNYLEIALLHIVNDFTFFVSFSGRVRCDLKKKEGLKFSLSQSMLLSDIFINSFVSSGHPGDFETILTVEKQNNPYMRRQKHEIVFQRTVNIGHGNTKKELPVPIVIEGGYIYAITFEFVEDYKLEVFNGPDDIRMFVREVTKGKLPI